MKAAARTVQIHAYVTDDEKNAFQAYADEHHLAASSLAGLLIARALKRSDLSNMLRLGSGQRGGLTEKITAHRIPSRTKRDFEETAAGLDLTESKLLRFLCRLELGERWLSRSLTIMNVSDIDSNRVRLIAKGGKF